jgi:hypothetical protein
MIEDVDCYWGGSPGRSWNELPGLLQRLERPPGHTSSRRHSEALPADDDRIPFDEVAESNALMERLGLKTRYLPDGRAYQIQRDYR